VTIFRTYDGKELQVCFSEPFGAVHEKKSLTIAYRVAHPLVGLHFSVPDEKYPQRPLFAMTGTHSYFLLWQC
jgi:hypothetical protein